MKSSSSQAQQFSKVAFLQLQSSLHSSSKSSHQKNKKAITKLNLFGKGITFIKQLSQQQTQTLKCIKQIDLSHNALTSIYNIKCLPIQVLILSHNKFIEQEQFLKIFLRQRNSQLSKNLTKIILKGNPFIKKPLSAQTRRWLFSIQNDLQINSRQQQQYLQLLIQRQVEKLTLQSLLHKVEMNLEFVKVYDVKLSTEEYERMILIKSQDFFKLIRRQMEWKFQYQQPFAKLRKFVVNQLSIEFFNTSNQQRPHSSIKPIATNLVLELKKKNQLLIKTNKELMTKIQNVVFNYLTQRKILVEKKVSTVETKAGLSRVQGIKTPMKNLKNSEVTVQIKDQQQHLLETFIIKKQQQLLHQPQQTTYPQISTPIYIEKSAPQSTMQQLISKATQQPSVSLNKQRKQSLSIYQGPKNNPIYGYNNLRNTQSSRNPFQQIISEVDKLDLRDYGFGSEQGDRFIERQRFQQKEKNIKQEQRQNSRQRKQSYHQYNRFQQRQKQVLRQNNNKENIIKIQLNNNNTLSASTAGMKKTQVNKATSKTLFQLSQSLLQKPIIPPSDESLHFDLQQGLAQSQIQKMFFTILTKINPIYHLLYSPLTSLKTTQMSQLIQNLLQLLKEKMKYVQKLQRYKVMYENEKQKSSQLMNVGKKNKQNKDILIEKNQQLTKQIKSLEKQFQKLSSQLQSKAQQNFILTEQNQRLHFEGSKFNDIRYQRYHQEDIQEKIITLRQQRLKKTYLNDMCLRGKKFFAYKEKMAQINLQKKTILLMGYFSEWKGEAKCQKMYRKLRQSFITKSINIFINNTSTNINLKKQQQNCTNGLIKAFKKIRLKIFVKKLSLNKQSIQNHKKSRQHYQKRIKQILFLLLKQNRQCEKLQKQNQIVMQFRKQSKQRLKKWVFDQWLIWQRGLAHKEIQVRVNHQGILACNVVEKLCNFYSYQKSFQAKSLALQIYLRDIRKINSFHKLLHQMSLKLQAWKLKLFKINMFTKRAYFDNFLSGIRRVKNKRRIKQKDQQKLRKKMLFDEMKQTKLKRSFIRQKFRRILKQGISQCINNNIQEFKKQIVTEKMYKRVKCESFFDSLRTLHRKNMTLRLKQKQVSFISKHYLKTLNSQQQFTAKSFFVFMRSSLRFKHSLIQFFMRKNKLLMQRTFYQFRISCLQQKSQFFQQKLKQLGPDIQLIQERQIQTNIEKISLTREVELKNQQIQEYEKQVCQLRLLLQAKEIKYEKLKDIYAQSIQINSRGRDIYEDIEKSITIPPQIAIYDTGYMNIVDDSKASSLKQSEDKYVIKTVRQQDVQKKPRVYNYIRYSPQRDIKLTQRRKQIGLQTKKKQIDNKDTNKSLLMSNNSNIHSKQKIMSDYYPSFRRF